MKQSPTAVVTGASSGIGLAVCERLVGRGYRVAMAARDQEKLRSAAAHFGDNARAIPTDVADPASVRRLIDAAWDAFGRIDALVNNAGYAPLVPVRETDDETARRIFAINALGPVYAVAAAWDRMTAQPALEGRPGPCVVNVSSVATEDPFPGLTVYGGAKAACEVLAKGCSIEGKGAGLRAFCVAPGAVETPMLRAIADEKTLPRHATLGPGEVADLIVACIAGEHDDRNGGTIFITKGEGVRFG